jgi:hypothetical protein
MKPTNRGAMVSPMPQPPALTPEQMGNLTLDQLLTQADSDETVGKMKVVSVLESLPGLGKVKARRLMETVGISDSRRLQGLGAKQRESLLKETAR